MDLGHFVDQERGDGRRDHIVRLVHLVIKRDFQLMEARCRI